MSCFVVENECIDVIVTYAGRASEKGWPGELVRRAASDPNGLGRELLAMNIEAYRQRYEKLEDYILRREAAYQFEPLPTNEFQALRSLDCFLWQCSEGTVPTQELFQQVEREALSITHRLVPIPIVRRELDASGSVGKAIEWLRDRSWERDQLAADSQLGRRARQDPEGLALELGQLVGAPNARPHRGYVSPEQAYVALRTIELLAGPVAPVEISKLSGDLAGKLVTRSPRYEAAVWGGPPRVLERELFSREQWSVPAPSMGASRASLER